MSQNGGRLAEREGAHHSKRTRRQGERTEVRLDDTHPAAASPPDAFAKLAGPGSIDLDGDHFQPSLRQGESDRTGPGTDLENELVPLEARFGYESIRELRR